MDDGWGRFNEFEGGAILFHWHRGAFDVPAALHAHWRALGGTGGLGYPIRPPVWSYLGAGAVAQEFEGGAIAWRASTGAHTVIGAIKERWYALYGLNGSLGFPATDELPSGRDPYGRVSVFDSGHIYWHPSTGAWSVRGVFLPYFLANGGLGAFGYPKEDHRLVDFAAGTLVQEYQRAWLRYAPATGVTVQWKTIDLPPDVPRLPRW
jgi:uncharacterized protein with LGFP repeats